MTILKTRSSGGDTHTREIVTDIIEAVRIRGDEALYEYGRRFDSPHLASIETSRSEIDEANIAPEREEAIKFSVGNVTRFYEEQRRYLLGDAKQVYSWRSTLREGGYLGQQIRPVERVGIYVPGGNANYPSSVIMNSVPALVAGVSEVHVASPAGESGSLSPAVLFAIKACGPRIKSAFKMGGAAAIAAFTFGTETVPKVDKIAGPGNKFVNEAKRQLWGLVGLDLYAGPSEVCVLADKNSNAAFCAADLLTQVEHAEDNVGFLVTDSEPKAMEILTAVEEQLKSEPRAGVIRAALRDHGAVFICQDLSECVEVVNAIAPEHLSVAVKDPESLLPRLKNAGCLLLGEYTPESAGDFILGPSHTLPTATAARFSSPVNVMDFMKFQSVCNLTKADLEGYSRAIEVFGEMEGFHAHGFGATVRNRP